jgi:predicted Zn-ribbon and HTH transcriptional regulator
MGQTRVGFFANRCPHCKSIEFRAVGARNVLEQGLQWLLQPYRCALCGHHFFLFRWNTPATA